MTHVLCHSLCWSSKHKTRCKAMLLQLKQICETHNATLVLIGDVLHGVHRHGKASLQCLLELKEALNSIPIHVVPAHKHDRHICELLHIPYTADNYLDDVYCCFHTSINDINVYSAKHRGDIPALFPQTSKDYKRARFVLLRTENERVKIPFSCGPKVHTWRGVQDDLSGVRGGDLVRLIYPTVAHMSRCRALQQRGVRIQTVQPRVRHSTTFWDFYDSHMRLHPAREAVRSLIESVIIEPVRIRFSYLRVENLGTHSIWLDTSGTGLEWVGGDNDTGKTTLMVHSWCWLLLGVWRGFEQPQSVGPDAFAECAGTIDGVPFRLQRRVTMYEHVCRLSYNGHDDTQNTPQDTTLYFHRRLLKWRGNSSEFYQKWMQHLVLQKEIILHTCPYQADLRKIFVSVQQQVQQLTRNIQASMRRVQAVSDLIVRMNTLLQQYKRMSHEWAARRRAIIAQMRKEADMLQDTDELTLPENDPHPAFAESLKRIEDLRNQYFKIVRRRRLLSVSVPTPSGYEIDLLRTQLEHAQQEHEARRHQNCDLEERVHARLIVDQCRTSLHTAIEEAKADAHRKFHQETYRELVRISDEIGQASSDVDEIQERVKIYDSRMHAYTKYRKDSERLIILRERMEMMQEDDNSSGERVKRLEKIIERKKEELRCMEMYQHELEQRRLHLQSCLEIDTIRSKWIEAWYANLDARANALWHVARWDDQCSLHNGNLFKNGFITSCSNGMEARRSICYFMALKDLTHIIPYMVINHIHSYLDLDGRVGLERLVHRWCSRDAIRTCWWLTRVREGTINMNGV